MATVDPDPFAPGVDGSRHAAYAALTADGPVQRITLPDGTPAWLVAGYGEVRQVLTDPRVVRAGPGGAPFADELPPGINAALNTTTLGLDPPAHTRLRRLDGAAARDPCRRWSTPENRNSGQPRPPRPRPRPGHWPSDTAAPRR